DAIDNSAGVDTSDHEVNLKILLNAVIAAGDLTVKQRNTLLQEMTDAVAEQVLRDNYLQSQALSLAEAGGFERLHSDAPLARARSGRAARPGGRVPALRGCARGARAGARAPPPARAFGAACLCQERAGG